MRIKKLNFTLIREKKLILCKFTMLERAVLFCGTDNKMSNSALIAGSSQQGKHLLASVASN